MLAMADRKGRIWASIPGLANRARVTLEETEIALTTFLSPDKYSRTPEHEGRRIEPIDGGWRLLNYEKHRGLMDEETVAETNRKAQARYREKRKESNGKRITVMGCNEQSPQAEAEAEAEAKKEQKTIARFSTSEIEKVYEEYPRKIGKGFAFKAIKKALEALDAEDPVEAMRLRVREFAESPAGHKGEFVPYPATWFNQKRYLDDSREWEKS